MQIPITITTDIDKNEVKFDFSKEKFFVRLKLALILLMGLKFTYHGEIINDGEKI